MILFYCFVSQHQRTVPTRGGRQHKRASRVAGSHRVASQVQDNGVKQRRPSVAAEDVKRKGGQVMQEEVLNAEGQVNKNVSELVMEGKG